MKPLFLLLKQLFVSVMLFLSIQAYAEMSEPAQLYSDTVPFRTVRGNVADAKTLEPLMFATLLVEGTNVATVCNSKGEFVIKIPANRNESNILISHTGYKKIRIKAGALLPDNSIKMEMMDVSLDEVSVYPTDPDYIIGQVLERRSSNYMDSAVKMTAFYRETIKKGWQYVSLTEAVVNINRQAYSSPREDQIALVIGRKSTDYTKLDTLAFRLEGGPFTTVMLDIMKDPYLLLYPENIGLYSFSMVDITKENNRLVYVLKFEQKEWTQEPLFYGRLYIDVEKLAIISAAFNMNLSQREKAAAIFIRKKPLGARIYPTEAAYLVNYRESNGRWHYSYSRAQVTFRVNWKRRLFNSNYQTVSEMAVTDWAVTGEKGYKPALRLRMNVVMEEAVAGFADDNFWGGYNVIEPEQPIEAVIRKIRKKLDD